MTSVNVSELIQALQRRTLALFIGADLPREITGLASRADLARELAHRHQLDESFPLAEVAQRVSQAGNRWEFTDFIRSTLDTPKSPQPFHQRVVALVQAHHIETIITTAYDNLLEMAFQQAGMGVNRVVRGGDVSFIRPDRPTLIKLYGDVQQPDTLVITDRDHTDLLRDHDKEPLIDEVRQAFRRNTMLFWGYNLADPDVRFLFDQIAESRFARIAYAVWHGLPETDVNMWRDRGIVILDTDPWGILGEVGVQPVLMAGASPVSATSSEATPGRTWDQGLVRQLVTDAFDDQDLTTFCFDHFRPIYERFAGGMTKTEKVLLLLDHCVRQGLLDRLLALVKELNPNQYNLFVERTHRISSGL